MSKEKRIENLIAIVGPSQSGKTTLAAGLAKTSGEGFTVGFADNATRDYLQPRIAGIVSGHWPEATSGENRDIRLNLNTSKGRCAQISFKEYMGEKIQDATYLEQVVGKPKGALILLSPGMDVLRDPIGREELIGNLKGIVDHLKKNKCVAIAFVVTACDRLKTDLRDFSESFEICVSEITNYLNTSGIVWTRFNVTITGELQEQRRPSIAAGSGNTSREPFLWIVDRVAGKKRLTAAKSALRIVCWIGAVALLGLGIVLGVQYHSDLKKLEEREIAVTAIENRIDNAISKRTESDLKKATDDLALWISSNVFLTCHFDSLSKRFESDIAKWSRLYDENRARYFSLSMDKRDEQRTDRGSEDDCRLFDKMLAEFKPMTDVKLKERLVKRWDGLRPKIRESYDLHIGEGFDAELIKLKGCEKNQGLLDALLDFRNKVNKWRSDFESSRSLKERIVDEANQLERDIYVEFDTREGNVIEALMDTIASDAAEKASAEALEDLRKQIAEWTPRTDVGSDRKKGLEDNFWAESPKWRVAYSDRICTEASEAVVRKIRGLAPDDQGLEADDVCDVLRDAFGFGEKYATATPEVLAAATNKIAEASGSFIDGLKTSFAKAWDINARKAPALSDDDRKFIECALDLANPENPDEKLSVDFLETLEVARTEAEGKWREAKKAICDKFVADTFTSGRSANSIFAAYRSWYEMNADNPSLESVDKKVEAMLVEYFESYLHSWIEVFWEGENWAWSDSRSAPNKVNAARRQFEDFKELCLALAKDPLGVPKNSVPVVFARLCRDKGNVALGFNKAFEQRLTISRIDLQVNFKETPDTFIGLSVGCIAKVLSCENSGAVIEKDACTFLMQDRTFNIESKDSGRRVNLFNGSHDLYINPWSGLMIEIPMEERVSWGFNNNFNLSLHINIYGSGKDLTSDPFSIFAEHDGPDCEADAFVIVSASTEGCILLDLWEEAGKQDE